MSDDAIDPALLDAAIRTLDQDGLAGLSLSSITAEADVSRVTLHRNKISVAKLLSGAVERAASDLRDSLWPAITSTQDAAARLSEAVETLCQVAERHSAILSALYHRPTSTHPSEPGRTTSFDFTEPFERILIDGERDGTLRSEDPADDAELLVNAVTWTYLHMRRSHRWPAKKAAARTTTLCVSHHTTNSAAD